MEIQNNWNMIIYVEKETNIIVNMSDLLIQNEEEVLNILSGDLYKQPHIEKHEVDDKYRNSFAPNPLYSDVLYFIDGEIIHKKEIHPGIINNNLLKIKEELSILNNELLDILADMLVSNQLQTFSVNTKVIGNQPMDSILQTRKGLKNKLTILEEMQKEYKKNQ